MGIPFPIAQLTVAVTDIAMNLGEKKGVGSCGAFRGTSFGSIFSSETGASHGGASAVRGTST